MLRCDLTSDLDLEPWTFVVYGMWRGQTTIFEQNRTICGGIMAISIFDLITYNVMCCAMLLDNFHTV